MALKVGLCGTIGSGKSTVCSLFAQLGAPVYIADDRAKGLMSSSEELKSQIVAAFGEECYLGGELNRQFLAAQIFGSEAKRLELNRIVHPAVCADFLRWAECQVADYVVVESAILFESGLDKVVDTTVAVVAPQSECLKRAAARDGVDIEAIKARMKTQLTADQLRAMAAYTIENNTIDGLAEQVNNLNAKWRI
ncbi:MAG: dephospho-CoA kinase [Alistipes sp.]|nr:dephospho-CoA kinase [Alistipes sp.]